MAFMDNLKGTYYMKPATTLIEQVRIGQLLAKWATNVKEREIDIKFGLRLNSI